MQTYLISYDLGVPETSTDYSKIDKYIKTFNGYCKPLYSQWIVKSDKTPLEIAQELIAITDKNDKILVINITHSDWGSARLVQSHSDWITSHM